MNGKLIFTLSLFGLAMGTATVFVISSSSEPFVWLAIFLICAWAIARYATGRYFVHGLVLGLLNSVWMTASHVLMFDEYIANHPKEASMMSSMPLPDSPKLMMALMGPIIGAVSGMILGLLAIVARKLMRRRV